MARLGEHIPRMLGDRGFEIAFSVPGIETIEIYRGVHGSGLRIIDVRNAAHAAFMAEGFTRARGVPAVCILERGPALALLAAPLAQARADSIPVLIITTRSAEDGNALGVDGKDGAPSPSALVGKLCVAQHRACNVDSLVDALDAARLSLFRERPGPVLIEVLTSALNFDGGAVADSHSHRCAALPAPKTPEAAQTADLVMRLDAAQRPVLILGGGASGVPSEQILTLAERLHAPVLMTSNGRGLLPPSHSLAVGGWLGSPAVGSLLQDSDLIVAIGTEFSSTEWVGVVENPGRLSPDMLIRAEIDPARTAADGAAGVPLICDAAALVTALLESLPLSGRVAIDVATVRAEAAASMPADLARYRPLLDGLWAHLPEAIIIADPCEPATAGTMCAMPPAPRRWHCAVGGHGIPGHALPMAVGAKLADPRRPVVVLMAETAVTDMLGALATAIEAYAHIVVIVWHSAGFREVREAMRAANINNRAIDVTGVDYQALSRGLGVHHGRIYGPENLREALRDAIMRPSPTVLELREEYWFG